MTSERENLIGRVAVGYLADWLQREDAGTLRFCMIGFDESLVSPIAAAVLGSELAEQVAVRIPRELADAELLPESVITDEAAAHWRNSQVPEPGKRVILFAIGSDELQRIGKTAEALPKLRPESLRDETDLWLAALGLGGDELASKERKMLENALKRRTARDGQRLYERLRSDVRPYLDRQAVSSDLFDYKGVVFVRGPSNTLIVLISLILGKKGVRCTTELICPTHCRCRPNVRRPGPQPTKRPPASG